MDFNWAAGKRLAMGEEAGSKAAGFGTGVEVGSTNSRRR